MCTGRKKLYQLHCGQRAAAGQQTQQLGRPWTPLSLGGRPQLLALHHCILLGSCEWLRRTWRSCQVRLERLLRKGRQHEGCPVYLLGVVPAAAPALTAAPPTRRVRSRSRSRPGHLRGSSLEPAGTVGGGRCGTRRSVAPPCLAFEQIMKPICPLRPGCGSALAGRQPSQLSRD